MIQPMNCCLCNQSFLFSNQIVNREDHTLHTDCAFLLIQNQESMEFQCSHLVDRQITVLDLEIEERDENLKNRLLAILFVTLIVLADIVNAAPDSDDTYL